MGAEILFVLILIAANGFFAGAEIAVVSIRRTRLQELADAGRGGAAALVALRASPERFLATVQIGITVVGAAAAAVGGASIAARLRPAIERVEWLRPYAEDAALAAVV